MKKIFALILALALALGLVACGGNNTTADEQTNEPAAATEDNTTAETEDEAPVDEPAETVTLKVAASPVAHAETLAQVKDVTEYTDYVVPNTGVEEGDEDVNYFQHAPYLNQFNEENGTHLVGVAAIHYEPFGIYPCLTASLDELKDGALVAVPNDVTNEARALLLLADNGLITLADGVGLNATTNDIVENPKNLQFIEVEAAAVANLTSEVDIAAINGNYALDAGFSSAADAIAIEDPNSEAAQTYANLIVVKEGNEENPAVLALVEALQSEEVRQYINDTYEGNVLPIF